MSTTCEIRPGRADMTMTRVDRKTASGMLWVTNTIVVPVRCQMLISSAFIRSRVISSRAPNGSSISSSFGSNERARAIATRCCMPPDSSQGWRSANASNSTSLSRSAARRRRSSAGKPMISSGSSMFLATVRQSIRTGAWKTIP